MSHIIKFQSFEEMNNYVFKGFYKKKFVPEKFEEFLEGFSGHIKNPYKPGVYKFKTFEEARKFEIKLKIKNGNFK
ncbi:MAG: hypothetical protein HY746_03860 [Elusimicrobia bacterium]|nr:hypothetical protein [Elusimicrobiota bacterium]